MVRLEQTFQVMTCQKKICIILIYSVMKINKKNYPQVYLEDCKYKIKKIQTPRFINAEIQIQSQIQKQSQDIMLRINGKAKISF